MNNMVLKSNAVLKYSIFLEVKSILGAAPKVFEKYLTNPQFGRLTSFSKFLHYNVNSLRTISTQIAHGRTTLL